MTGSGRPAELSACRPNSNAEDVTVHACRRVSNRRRRQVEGNNAPPTVLHSSDLVDLVEADTRGANERASHNTTQHALASALGPDLAVKQCSHPNVIPQ